MVDDNIRQADYKYTYSVGNPVGEGYIIEPYGLTSTNYNIKFEKGNLKVKPAEINFANINEPNKPDVKYKNIQIYLFILIIFWLSLIEIIGILI